MENMYPVRTPKEILKSKTCEFLKKKNQFQTLLYYGTWGRLDSQLSILAFISLLF